MSPTTAKRPLRRPKRRLRVSREIVEGAQDLGAFLRGHELTLEDCASSVQTTRSSVSQWCAGLSRPRPEYRAAIERYTRGDVRAASWLTEDEQAIVEAVVPYRKSSR